MEVKVVNEAVEEDEVWFCDVWTPMPATTTQMRTEMMEQSVITHSTLNETTTYIHGVVPILA
jgi:hypothetical protein